MSKKVKLTEKEIDQIVVSQADNDSAWENPVRVLRGKDLLNSSLVGMWAERTDIGDSVAFARKLRAEAQVRKHAK